MRLSWTTLALASLVVLAGCKPGQIVVTAEIDAQDPETGETVTRPIADLEIEVLPFDRDLVFDSLEAAFGIPEPEIPEDLLRKQEEVAAAQAEWRQAEAEWSALRDRLKQITEDMKGLSRGEARYVALYREFQDGEQRLARVERRRDEAFRRFTDLQEGMIRQADSVRMARESWADEAFADVPEVFLQKLREVGREILYDTTDAEGMAVITVEPGQWWIHARYELPFQELYWNIPITAERGKPVEIRLTRETAEVRPRL